MVKGLLKTMWGLLESIRRLIVNDLFVINPMRDSIISFKLVRYSTVHIKSKIVSYLNLHKWEPDIFPFFFNRHLTEKRYVHPQPRRCKEYRFFFAGILICHYCASGCAYGPLGSEMSSGKSATWHNNKDPIQLPEEFELSHSQWPSWPGGITRISIICHLS